MRLNFDVRLQNATGKDMHRVFKGTMFYADESLSIVEAKDSKKGIVIQIIADRNRYQKPNSTEFYTLDDIRSGTKLHVANQVFAITAVEGRIESNVRAGKMPLSYASFFCKLRFLLLRWLNNMTQNEVEETEALNKEGVDAKWVKEILEKIRQKIRDRGNVLVQHGARIAYR